MGCAQGAKSRLLLEPGAGPHTFDASSEIYEFTRCTLQKKGRHIGGRGIRGNLSSPSERVRLGAYTVMGEIHMNISPLDFVTLLPKMLGGTESPSGTFNVGDDLPYFGALVDKVADIYEYTDCKVNQWILRGRGIQMGEQGEPDMLTLTLQIVGKSEASGESWPASPPSLPLTANAAPFTFADSAVTILSEARPVLSFALYGNNFLQPLYTNSLTATSICARDRAIGVQVTTPLDSEELDLYGQAVAGATASIVLTNGSVSTAFNFGALQVPDEGAIIEGKSQLILRLEGTARSLSTTKELVVVNDSTSA